MKENLKVKINSVEEREEAQNLFHSMGSRIFRGSQFEVVVVYELMKPFKEITLPELRELARPKEYLNSEFELVVTNQPEDDYILVPDGADKYTHGRKYGLTIWEYSFWIDDVQSESNGSSTPNGSMYSDYVSSGLLHKILWQRENKVETSKGRFLHQWAYEAFGRGEDVQHTPCERDCDWTSTSIASPISIFSAREMKFRIKPQTIQIGSRTIVKPISVKPEIGTMVYVASITNPNKSVRNSWNNQKNDYMNLNRGILHLTESDAIAHTEALLELMK